MIGYGQAIILGLLQGFSELFPISSLGHSVILPRLLGWDIHQNDDFFITFLVATHLATALVLLGFFWKRLGADRQGDRRGASATARSPRTMPTRSSAGCWSSARSRPASSACCSSTPCATCSPLPASAAFFLMVNGVLLYGAERLRRRAPEREVGDSDERIAERLSWREAVGVGTAQALALIPGISRTGRDDGRRPRRRLWQRGRRPLLLPARDADHRRGRDPQAARAVR